MADYQTELSQSGTTLTLKPADGFQRSTVMGEAASDTHQFTGSIYQTGSGGTNYFRDSNVFGYVAPNTFSASITHEITGSTFLTGSVWQYPTVEVTPNAGGPGIHLTSSYVRSVTTSSFHLRSVSGEEIQAGVMQDVVTETSTSWSDGYPGVVTPAQFPTYINITDGYKTAYGVNANTFFRMQNGALSMYGSSRLINTQVTGNLGGNIVLGGAAYQVDGGDGTSADGITIEPYTCYSVYLTGGMNPINLPHNFKDTSPSTHEVLGRGDGEVSFFGSGSTTAGYLHYLNHHGGWEKTNAAGTGSWGSGSAGNAALLAIAMPVLAGAVYVKTTNPTASIEGMLTRGHFNVVDAFTGSWINGSAVYVHAAVDGLSGGGAGEAGAGKFTCTAPTSSNSYVRIVGYCTDTPNVIVFDPDKSWVENS